MAQDHDLDGHGEHRRGLEGTVDRIVRQLKVGPQDFPAPHIYEREDGGDIDPSVGGIWLPKIDDDAAG